MFNEKEHKRERLVHRERARERLSEVLPRATAPVSFAGGEVPWAGSGSKQGVTVWGG